MTDRDTLLILKDNVSSACHCWEICPYTANSAHSTAQTKGHSHSDGELHSHIFPLFCLPNFTSHDTLNAGIFVVCWTILSMYVVKYVSFESLFCVLHAIIT